MAVLTKLKTSAKERSQSRESVEQRLRRKMILRLLEQKEFAEADNKGEQIIRMRQKWFVNTETGQTERREVPKKIRRWYWKEATGNICLKLLYGSSPIAFNGEASTIEIKELSKLPETIDMLIEAVEAGELDEPMNRAMGERRLKLRRIK